MEHALFGCNQIYYYLATMGEDLTSKTSNMNKSYVTATKSIPTIKYPKREQAIILDASEELRLSDYVIAIGNIVSPKNIISASKISNNRICIYLSSTQILENLLEKEPLVKIQEKNFKIRKLITPAKRIIISNVHSSIPHEIIETSIKSLGFQLVSPITTLRAGIPGDEYSHIESFRRQVFITPPTEADPVLPPTIIINHEETAFRIFLSYDEMKCFLCKEAGHVANKCPNLPEETETVAEAMDDENIVVKNPVPTTSQQPRKRHVSSSTTTISEQDTNIDNSTPQIIDENEDTALSLQVTVAETFQTPPPKFQKPKKITHVSKKAKKSVSTENLMDNLEKLLEPTKMTIQENPTKFPIPYENFQSFIENSFECEDILLEIRRHTSKIEDMRRMIHNVYPLLTSTSLKNRFTRLQKKITKRLSHQPHDQNAEFSSDTESISSQQSEY